MPVELKPQNATGRLEYLDGLRGAAALFVVFFHFLSAYYYWLIPDQTDSPATIAHTPFAIFYNGPFFVIVFFVLSGFVVSNSAAKGRDPLIASIVLRYLRLALPATASILFAWILLMAMPDEMKTLSKQIPHGWLAYTYQGRIPGIRLAILSGMFNIFREGGSLFNNVLWTMRIELLGSILLYILHFVAKDSVKTVVFVFLAIAMPMTHRTVWEGFILGALLRELWAHGRLNAYAPKSCFFVGAMFGFEGSGFHLQMHLPHVPTLFMLGEKTGIWYPVGAALMVYGCLTSPALQSMLSIAPARFLGRVSFSLYLLHVPLLYTVFAVAYMAVAPVGPFTLFGLLLAFLGTSLTLAYLGTIGVDEPVLRLNAWIRRMSREVLKSRKQVLAKSHA